MALLMQQALDSLLGSVRDGRASVPRGERAP